LKSILRKKTQEESLRVRDGIQSPASPKGITNRYPEVDASQGEELQRRAPRRTGSVGKNPPPNNKDHLHSLFVRLTELSNILGGGDDLVRETLDVDGLCAMHTEFITMFKIENPQRVKMFGVPLAETVLHHSCSVLLDDRLCVFTSCDL